MSTGVLTSWFAAASLTWLAGGFAGPGLDPLRVAHGNVALTCQLPSVVALYIGDERCTGVVLHPRVVLTDAHCLPEGGLPEGGRPSVRFGEATPGYVYRVHATRCHPHPDATRTGEAGLDLAVCVLEGPIPVPVVPLADRCDEESLRPATGAPGPDAASELLIAGFGLPEASDSTMADEPLYGMKRYAFTAMTEQLDANHIALGDRQVNACLGDSGGPVFLRHGDGNFRLVALHTTSPGCGEGPSTATLVGRQRDWIEEATGFSLDLCPSTPGALGTGRDAPEDCASFDADPLRGGDWRTWCGHDDPAPVTLAPSCDETPRDPASPRDDSPPANDPPGSSSCQLAPGAAPLAFGPGAAVLGLRRRRRRMLDL